MLKNAPPEYFTLHHAVRQALASDQLAEWRPLLIGVDGVDGAGKTSLASWLAWQFGIPAIHLDVFIDQDSESLKWRSGELSRVLDGRLKACHAKPVIVEGICLLRVLEEIKREPDFLIFVTITVNEGAYFWEKKKYSLIFANGSQKNSPTII